jgi:hypothetical protein
LEKRQFERELPLAPPLREVLDPDNVPKGKRARLPLDPKQPRLLCFPLGSKRQWQLHHAAPFAAVRWTNVHDPAWLVFCGDVISSPAAGAFGPAVIDIDLRRLRGQSLRFSHTRYWSMPKENKEVPMHISVLRETLDLAGKRQF